MGCWLECMFRPLFPGGGPGGGGTLNTSPWGLLDGFLSVMAMPERSLIAVSEVMVVE